MTIHTTNTIINSFNLSNHFDLESFNAIISTLTTLNYPIINATSSQIIYIGSDGEPWMVRPDGISINQYTGEMKMGEV